MTSQAAKAKREILKRQATGDGTHEALRAIAEAGGAATGERNGRTYAAFPDESYLRIEKDGHLTVITDNSGRFTAWKVINGIQANCRACGQEIWCDRNGRPAETQVFHLPGQQVNLCTPCQREIIAKALVGE